MFREKVLFEELCPGPNPTIVSYSASVVKITTLRVAFQCGLKTKNNIFFYFKKRST
jgi:hypothetical protein